MMTDAEEMSGRIRRLRDQRGLSATLADRLWMVADPSLVGEVEAATDEQIAELNAAYAAYAAKR